MNFSFNLVLTFLSTCYHIHYPFYLFCQYCSFYFFLLFLHFSSSIYISGYEAYALTGWKLGQREPVLGHKDYRDVSLVVNDYYFNTSLSSYTKLNKEHYILNMRYIKHKGLLFLDLPS